MAHETCADCYWFTSTCLDPGQPTDEACESFLDGRNENKIAAKKQARVDALVKAADELLVDAERMAIGSQKFIVDEFFVQNLMLALASFQGALAPLFQEDNNGKVA